MTIASFAKFFANWSDLVSLVLLFLTVLSNGLDPICPLWGFPWHENVAHFISMAVLVAFAVFRFILEGVYSAIAPREFLTISVLYSARWLYLFYTLHWSSNLPCRFTRVAKTVAKLATLRVGRSTYPDRRGEKEVVVRKGAKNVTSRQYWRGVTEKSQHIGDVWIVYLLDTAMHMDLLAPIATTTYAHDQNNSLHDFYRRLYDTVMTVEGAGESHVDWTNFLERYSPITKTNFAMRAGATADTDLAGVARRIAADACNYVSGSGEFRTEFQIQLMNLCIEKAAEELVRNVGGQEAE